MGVHGLTTYLRENKHVLSKTIEFNSQRQAKTPLVVDGWSFIYVLWNNSANLPWVYGGDYGALCRLVLTVVRAWIEVGLKPLFVFDGPSPQLKFPTLVSRLAQSNIQPSLLFFRTSAASRSTPRFLHESRILPPLAFAACIQALQSDIFAENEIEVHYADEEGDPYAVELAGRVKGYVAGLDSDFTVLNTEGYEGYMPLDEMLWLSSDESEDKPNDGEFQTVRKAKARKKPSNHGRGLIPPDATSSLSLSVAIYRPSMLASHLQLPVSLLPLLGAFLGNDFTSRSSEKNQSKFFDRRMTPSQRVTHVASTLRTILSPGQKRRQKQPGSVVELIDLAVTTLLARPAAVALSSAEQALAVENIVQATLQYALPKYEDDYGDLVGPWPTTVCALHPPDACPLVTMLARTPSSNPPVENDLTDLNRDRCRALYTAAYRGGSFSPLLMDILSTATHWPELFLENPDLECVARSIGRPIREWIYAILDEAIGLPEILQQEEDDDQSEAASFDVDEVEGAEDEDELIDVVEESSDDEGAGYDYEGDSLEALRGALQQLRVPEDTAETRDRRSTSASTSSRARRRLRPKLIVEYVRRGTRLAAEEVTVPSLTSLLTHHTSILEPNSPLLLQSAETRLTVFLRALESDTDCLRALDPEPLVQVLAVRWVVRRMYERARDSGSGKDREKERWLIREARAFLASFSAPHSVDPEAPAPLIVDRNIQLTAQVLMALESINHLSQTLLLTDVAPSVAHAFSGQIFHAWLTSTVPVPEDSVPSSTWKACVDGLEDMFGEERLKKGKKEKKEKKAPPVGGKAKGIQPAQNSGMFGLLAELE